MYIAWVLAIASTVFVTDFIKLGFSFRLYLNDFFFLLKRGYFKGDPMIKKSRSNDGKPEKTGGTIKNRRSDVCRFFFTLLFKVGLKLFYSPIP